MSSELRLRRGTGTQHNSFTGAEAEVTVNTTNKSVHVHDGTTSGGFELARVDLNNVDNSVFAAKAAAAGISGGAGGSAAISAATKASPVVVTTNIAHGFIDGQQVSITDVGGMTQLNGKTYYVDVLTSTTFALYTDVSLTTPVNGTAYTTYTSGGTAVGADFAGAPISGSYITVSAEAGLPNERRLQAGTGLSITDGGAGGAVSVAANLAATAPSNLGSANAGVSNLIARADHVHAMPTATDVGAVPTSRQVLAGTGLSGGGALTSNVTLSLNANLHMLTDVTINGTPLNGDVLMYNSATSQFENSSTFAKNTILLNNSNVAVNTINKLNFIGTGITASVNGVDSSRIDIAIATSNTTEVQNIVGNMVSSNTENGIAVTYDAVGGKINFDVNDPVITLSGDVTGTATMTDLGNVTISTTIAANSVALGNDTTGNYVATITAGNGIAITGAGVESASVKVEVNTAEPNFLEELQDIVGTMVSGNSENGIAVVYDDTLGKLNFQVGNPTITLSGAVTGAATITNLANATINTSIAVDAVALGTNTTGNYIATISGSNGISVTGSGVESAAVTIGLNTTNPDFVESIQDIIGSMVESNTENGIAVVYDDNLGKLNFDVNDPVITVSGAVNGSATMTNLGNTTITVTQSADSVTLGTHTVGNYVANIVAGAGITVTNGSGEGLTANISVNTTNVDFIEAIQDIVGSMVETNTENGIAVTYDDATGKLNFDVADPVVTLSGDVTGSATMTNLGNITISTTIAANSVALGTDTTGNYVATITGANGITVTGSGVESAAISLGLDRTNTDFRNIIQDITANIFTSANGLTIVYNDTNNTLSIDPNDPVITLAGAVTGSATMTNLGNTTITVAQAADSVTLGTHTTGNYIATITGTNGITVTGSGVESAAASISINTANADFIEAIQDIVGGMVDTNTEAGVAVVYDDVTGKLNFDVNDPVITLSGDVTGSATMANLGNVTITTTIAANSVALGADTTGNYVATITGANGITVTGSGVESAAIALSLDKTNTEFRNTILDVAATMFASGNGLNIVYTDATNTLSIDPNDPTITLSGDVTGSATITNLGNVTIAATIAPNSVELGIDTVGNYVSSITGANGIVVTGSGVESAAIALSLDKTNAEFRNTIQDVAALMFSTGSGLTVTYNDTTNAITIDPNDPVITLSGDVVGSATMTNLGNVTINTTIAANSVALGTDTTGNYVATITGANGIVVTGSGVENAAIALTLDKANTEFRNTIQDVAALMFSTGSGLNVTYNDTTNAITIDPNDPLITVTGSVIGSATMTNLGNVTITVAQANDSVTLGTHTVGNYVANVTAGKAITVTGANVETADITVAVDTGNADFVEDIQDIVGAMVGAGSIKNGISVVYDDATAKLNFNVEDPIITLTGGVTGSAQMIDLGSVTITTTVADNSHNHTIANITGLQAELDSKLGGAGGTVTGTINTQSIVPVTNGAYSIGTSALKYTTVWAATFNGTAVQAQYADLAERYHADAKYPIGTVVKLGGSKEITATNTANDTQVIGVISENPAYLMNDGAGDPNEWLPVAMTGRVRVKIVGPVTKGQRIVSSSEPGVAMAVNDSEITSFTTVIGRALRSDTDPNIKLVECIIGKL
jgi:hypothetical protein